MIDNITGPDPNISFNYLRLATFFALPVVVIILSFLFWMCKGGFNSAMSRKQLFDNTVATIAIIWFVFYPTIV